MADNIPIPQGASLGEPIPQGASIGAPGAVPIPQGATIEGGAPAQVGPERGVLANIVGGIEKGAAKSVTGLANLAARGVEKATGMPEGSLQSRPGPEVEQPSVARNLGEGVENIGEFMTGEAGLEGLAKAAKVTEMAQKYPLIAKTLQMAKEHPVIAKMVSEGTKGAVVGGAQGAAKGAAEGNGGEEAAGGAVGGGMGGAAAAGVFEAATPLAEAVAKKFGVGADATKEAVQAARPGKRNYKFADDFLRAAPHLDEVNAFQPAKTIEDWADNAQAARESLYQNKIEPLVATHATEPLGGLNIATGIRNKIPNAMKTYAPEQAALMEQTANDFMPQQKFQLQVGDAEEALQHFNAELAATGFWSKMPAEREALLKTDGTVAGLKAAADSIRDEFYGKLNQLSPGSNVAELKKDYGALRNVEDELRGRINVNDRQNPISLRETIGLITGLAHGGPVGAAIMGGPIMERLANSPERAFGRAVQKAVRPGEEGAISKGVQAVGRGAKSAAPEAAALGGAAASRIVFTASDGTTHSIPDDPQALAHARTIDPKLVVHATSWQPPLE